MAFPVTSPGPLLPLDAPLPQPRSYTLLDTANLVPPTADDRWMAGAQINSYPAGRPEGHDPCSTGTFRLKSADSGTPTPLVYSFTVVVGGSCTARSVGPNSQWYTDRLARAFPTVESEEVERVLVSGDHLQNQEVYIGDPNMDAPVGNTPQTPLEGLAVLEDAIAAVGNGIIHVAPATATYWVSLYLIEADKANIMRTRLGTPVVVGAGYRGARPDAYGGLSAGQEWAFATGPIDIRRAATVTILPGLYGQALDRTSNEVTFYAERDYLLSWVGRTDSSDDEHVQTGVLIGRI